ncbi:hypothetical protein [Bacillus sp. MRMR6]|uniref:hypothetical protein n=1 Tax=Bacillus sp. MRMR6 TaxID=1928617 RepID=UPI000951DA3B|nr:hypothetical protein [Bacillus sp. MRMR6]OLS33709.1 hypothetical protein BTR25_24415 [Bacillus sp. MRMR6]
MRLIASQSYLTVTRVIKWNKQHYITNEHELYLYEEKIVTKMEQFLIEDVYDITYRPFSTEFGFLYLHTNRGVFPFRTKNKPYQFIEEYKGLRKNNE